MNDIDWAVTFPPIPTPPLMVTSWSTHTSPSTWLPPDSKNDVTGYVVVRAESHEAAARLFEGHPHFTLFPGDSVEIMHVPAASPNWDKGKCSGSAPAQLGVCTSKMANLYGRWWVWARSPGVSPVRLGKRLSGDGGCLSGPLPPPDVQGGRVG